MNKLEHVEVLRKENGLNKSEAAAIVDLQCIWHWKTSLSLCDIISS